MSHKQWSCAILQTNKSTFSYEIYAVMNSESYYTLGE